MKTKKNFSIPLDQFIDFSLYNENSGYYMKKNPFGKYGDYITAPNISRLFSEMIAIWIISFWQSLGSPKKFNLVELGAGNGEMMKVIIESLKNFPIIFKSCNFFIHEKSTVLIKNQKKILGKKKVIWISKINKINRYPTIFIANEFFDAIPIKQFKNEKGILYEKHYKLDENDKIKEIFKKASKQDTLNINSYKSLRNLKFVEFPKYGLKELDKIIKKILQVKGCLLMVDYGYLKSNNQNTLQSVMKHKKNYLINNLGKADITSHVNFELLNEFFIKNNLKVKKIISQQKFLKKMGIIERAEIISKNMNFKDRSNMYLRLKRLLSSGLMGELFKVSLAYNSKTSNFFGFN